MRNKRLIYTALFALSFLCGTFVACDKDDDNKSEEKTTDDIINQIPTVDGDKVLSVDEQKDYLDQVGKAFMTEFQSTNFDNVIDLINYAYETYKDYNWDNVESWADDAYESLTKTDKGLTLESEYKGEYEQYDYENYDPETDTYPTYILKYINQYYKNNTEVIYKASAYTGHFVAENGAWTYTPADDLQFQFADQNGKTCLLTLTTSGKNVNAYFGEDYQDWYGDSKDEWNDDCSVRTETYTSTDDVEQIVVSVPEKAVLTLTQDGKTIVNSVVNTDLSIVSSTDYDITKDTYAATTTTEINGYTIEVSKASLSNKDKKAEGYFKLKKGDVKLLECTVNANGNVSRDENDEIEVNSLTTEMTIDILGKVQIKGSSKDGDKFADLMDEADENEYDGTIYKEKIAAANALVDYGLYFNGNTKQAQVVMEPFEEEDWNDTYWDYDFVIQFADGSKSAFDDYFIRANFGGVSNLYDDMEDDYTNKVKVDD